MSISIGDALLKLKIDKGDFDRDMKGIGASLKKHQKAIGIGMTAAGATILAGLGLSLKAAADFEGAMREVNTMMGLSQEEFTDFSAQVQALASDLGVDAVESANALYQAISAGIPKENVLTFLEVATKAAIGGMTDTETAVDGLTTVINAFKIPVSDAQKVADVMFTTVKGGKTTFDELSASLFQVAPIAAASGVEFEEVSAALATMTKQGVPTKVATTQLRQAMVSLSKPTADMNEVIQRLGYESGQVMLQELGLADTLNILRDATGGSNEMLMKMFGSVEAGGAVLALTGENAVTFAADLDAMTDSTGAATDAFNEMEQSATRQMEALKNSAKDIAISIGNVLLPILKDLLDKLKPIIEDVKNWMKENPELTKTIILAGAAIGGLLMGLGSLLLILPKLKAAFIAMGHTLKTMMLNPIIALIGALAMLGYGIYSLIQTHQKWGEVVEAGAKYNEEMEKSQGKLTVAVVEAARAYVDLRNEVGNILPEEEKQMASLEELITLYDEEKLILNETTGELEWQAQATKKLKKEIEELSQTLKESVFSAYQYYAAISGRELTPFERRQMELLRRGLGIPELQEGGIISRPTLAMIGERGPEAVVPLDRMGGYRTANIYMIVDGRMLARVIGQPLIDEIRIRTGAQL